jgi:LacI family transcriptional regulator
MAATIQDIAVRAGVSPGTVSRILNGKNKENRPTMIQRAARVRELATELGYRPNAAARSILSGKFGLVAFVTCGDWGADWFPRSVLHGIHQALEEQHLRLVITEVKADRLNDPKYAPTLVREASVDGIIVHLDTRYGQSAIDYFESLNIPVIWVNNLMPRRAVYPDDEPAARMLTEQLIAEGHRKIGYVRFGQEFVAHYSVAARREGYRAAMAAAGLPTREWERDYPGEALFGAEKMAAEFMDVCGDCTAAVCYEVSEAVTLHAAAARCGRRVPEDLKIVAFHEREVRSHTGLEIPTMLIPFYEIGYSAATMLMRISDGKVKNPASVAVEYGPVMR